MYREEILSRATLSEELRGVQQAHNKSRNEAQRIRMEGLKNLCKNFDHILPLEYLETASTFFL